MTGQKRYLRALALLEAFALIAQFILQQQNSVTGRGESLIRFFSYYTILTNILVGIYATVELFGPKNKRTGFFAHPSVQTAITLHITVVGLIYNLLLRQLWVSTGLQAVLHELLHTAIPLLMIIYWWVWTDTRNLQYKNIPAWLVYPALYAVLVMIRGHFAAWYPYPFLDATTLDHSQVIINIALMIVVFILFSFLFVILGKRKKPHG